ncbi:galactose oxidase-like domain-containing protein [Methyloglobulus morosus]
MWQSEYNVPANPNIVPLGWYMLFIVDNSGIPPLSATLGQDQFINVLS